MNKKIFITSIFLAGNMMYSSFCFAQQADQQIGELINKNDWFELDKQFPKLKNEIQSPILRLLSETMLSLNFNKPQAALDTIQYLLDNYQGDMGFDNTISMVYYFGQLLNDQGKYAEGADCLGSFLTQIEAFAKKEDFPEHVALYQLLEKLKNEKAPELIRPDHDTEIPFSIEKIGSGELLYVPVTIHGKVYSFIFDTGASVSFVSKRLADEIGLRIVNDSSLITGVGQAYGQMGILDGMSIGDIEFNNSLFAVAFPNPAIDSLAQIDAVLGLNFMKAVKEVQIDVREKKIVFPVKQSSLPVTGRNLMILNNQPYIETGSGGERLIFHLDLGNVMSELHMNYYSKHKEWVEINGTRDIGRSGGFGGVKVMDVFRLPSFPLQVGMTRCNIDKIHVNTEKSSDAQQNEDGALGINFVRLFRKVIINFDCMFIDVAL